MNSFDSPASISRRQTLKAAACTATAGILGAFSGTVSAYNAISSTVVIEHNIPTLHCKLIRQPDSARAYILITNPTTTTISLTGFKSEVVHFDGAKVNLADAFYSQSSLPSQQNMMMEISLESGLNNHPVTDNVHCLDNCTHYLAEGTRVVSFSALVENHIASIAHATA